MAIAVFFEFPNESIEKYDQALAETPDLRNQEPRSHHICFKTESGWGVVDVWESEESFAKFGETLGPILQKLGLQAQPKVHPVHNTM
jgi:hypothetical protein